MINYIIKTYGGLKPVVIDGFLYVVIAVCGTVTAILTQDDAYKYVNPYVLYIGKSVFEVLGAATTALKMFRSTSYGDHRTSVDAKAALNLPDKTQTITQQQTTKVETKSNEKTPVNPPSPGTPDPSWTGV